MANPQSKTIPKNTWTKVASNVTEGTLTIVSGSHSDFIYTTRAAGGRAPTLSTDATARPFPSTRSLGFSEDTSTDIYMFYDGPVTGRVVVE